MENTNKKLAVFDIDGTIFRSSLTIQMFNELIKEGIAPESALENTSKVITEWQNRQRSYRDVEQSIVDEFLKNLVGKNVEDVKRASEQVVNRVYQQVYVYTRDLISQLKKDGYYLLAISGSPVEVVNSFVTKWGFDNAYATVLETKDGKYTGAKSVEAWKIKKELLAQFVKEHDFSLEGSVGVGDTFSDVAFLEMVENPIAFNPNQQLYDEAKARGWKIVVERKDVIYHL